MRGLLQSETDGKDVAVVESLEGLLRAHKALGLIPSTT